MFGPHLIIDGSKCDTAKLNDRLLIERILTDYPQAIGMTRIGGPYMFEYQAPDPAYSGVSGLVVIAESHIAIHTFPVLDYFTMDIFSCKNFDHEVAIQYIREALGVQEMDRMLVQRGLSFRGPHHGPLGATDELIAEAAKRHQGLGVTIGSIPTDDPLYPRSADVGQMLWPTYGMTPDVGSLGTVSGGVRQGASVVPVNAAAAGDQGRAGLLPVQPVQLNPTASTSGLLDRLAVLGGQGRQLGKVLNAWEAKAREGHPIVLAIGPEVVGLGLRDLVADLIQRGHVAAVVLEGDALFADAYEALGYRHYLAEMDEAGSPARPADEQAAALATLTQWLGNGAEGDPLGGLARAVTKRAPRPGILAAATKAGIPIAAIGTSALTVLGVESAIPAACRHVLEMATLVAFGTTEALYEAVAVPGGAIFAIDAATKVSALTVRVDVTIALPLLAMGLVQRMPHGKGVSTEKRHRELLPVG